MQIIMAYVDDLGGDDSQWMFPNFKKGKQNSVVLINTHVSYNNMLKLLIIILVFAGGTGCSVTTCHSINDDFP